MAGQGFARFGLTLILPDMRVGLGLSNADLGLLAGAAFAAYLVCAAPAGAAAARFGPRRVASASLLVSALGLALTGLAPNFAVALLAQTVNGAAGAGVIIPVLGLSPGWFPRPYWARATGAIVAGGGVGLIASGLFVPAVLRIGGEAGWRLAWLSLALALLVAAGLAFVLLRDPPRSPDERGQRPGLQAVYRTVAVWWIGLAFGCYGVAFATYGTFFGAHLVGQRGLDGAFAGQLWALGGLASIPSGLLGGWLADRFGRRGSLALLFLVQGVAVSTLALGTEPGWYVASALLYGLTVWGFPAVITAAAADAVGPELTPAAVGLAVFGFSIGQALGPPIGGLLAELSGSFSPALLGAAAADLLGLTVAARLASPARSRAAPGLRPGSA